MTLNYTKDGGLGTVLGGESWHGKEIQYLRIYMMVKGVQGSGVKVLRTWVYSRLAELVYRHIRKGSRIGVIDHIQQGSTRQGKMLFEIVPAEVDFLRIIEWQTEQLQVSYLKKRQSSGIIIL